MDDAFLKNLSEEDKAWADALINNSLDLYSSVKDDFLLKALQECIKNERVDRIDFILKTHSFPREKYFEPIKLAVEIQSEKTLNLLLPKMSDFFHDHRYWRYDSYTSDYTGHKEEVKTVFDLAKSGKASIWSMLKNQNCGVKRPFLDTRGLQKIALSESASPEIQRAAYFEKTDRDTMTEIHLLPNSGKTTSVFNFVSKQQTTFFERENQISGISVKNFSEIDGIQSICEVFVSLGGKTNIVKTGLQKQKKIRTSGPFQSKIVKKDQQVNNG